MSTATLEYLGNLALAISSAITVGLFLIYAGGLVSYKLSSRFDDPLPLLLALFSVFLLPLFILGLCIKLTI